MTDSPLLLRGSILPFIVGSSLLTFFAIRTYQDSASIPERIVEGATVLVIGLSLVVLLMKRQVAEKGAHVGTE